MKNNSSKNEATKKTLLALLLFLVFGAGAIAFACSGYEENIAEMLIPTILFSFFSLCSLYALIRCAVIGLDEYVFEGDVLHIKRKGNAIVTVRKEDICDLVVVNDVSAQGIVCILFRHEGKKRIVPCDEYNEAPLLEFIRDLPAKERDTRLWEVIRFLLDMLSKA